ncbi:hypothetical protein VW23_007200 [Devosia insulae DS-56]|uniref:DUF2280 domain-containing protein n=1 Tax=Devosia insulae DS-56 TaxID=1116389 RepID=A0A1E5XH45_9HYPH|nr:DUF2280 domain-containing protein [Devosia insulae]OEO27917.1 hypothetical protein VW23_007200 [Devosia insulae DS-56]
MAKGKLTDEVQTFVVTSLAMFDTPMTVADAVKKEFGIEITRQAVECYDPTEKAGAKLAEKWKALFEEARKAFVEDTADIAISHRAVRLRALHRMSEKAEGMNLQFAAALLRQAAEEMGGTYTNRREFTGKDGKDLPTPVSPVTIFQLPDNGRG